MKSSFNAFGLGVALTAMTLGAVTYVNASTNATIQVCANKKTGAMRYITKGKCNKTENALTWNQQGPQGPQGLQGPSGIAGPTGSTGAAGQNLRAVDANGRDIGLVISWDGAAVSVLSDGAVWSWDITAYVNRRTLSYFFDAACTTPFVLSENFAVGMTPYIPMSNRYVLANNPARQATAAYRATGAYVQLNSLPATYQWNDSTRTCRRFSLSWDGPIPDYVLAYRLETTGLLEFTAPLSIVSR